MPFVDVIARKRDGEALARADIERFVRGVTDGAIPAHQAAALLMAIVLRGMSLDETAWLTEAMLASGARVDLSGLPGTKVGKHSTGGVGDKLSLVFVPLVASCGVVVPKMSGRALGHTGGTIDKLESIPGFRVAVEIEEFARLLRDAGAAIVGQTAALVPADRTLYALRDETATVESVPLIAASIMSKKLAEGSDALVLDVKCGRGAFMHTEADARALAATLVAIGRHAGVPAAACITAMDVPLGRAVGNAVEVIEAVEVLKGRGPDDVRLLATTLASRALCLAGRGEAEAEGAVARALSSGAALETLRTIVARQGGDVRALDDYARLPAASTRVAVRAERSGFVADLDAMAIGLACARLGAGRERAGEAIDHGAGVLIVRGLGEPVRAGEAILELRCNDRRGRAEAESLARGAIRVADDAPPVRPLVLGWVA